MNIDINLLVQKSNYYKIEGIFQLARKLTVAIGILVVVILGGLFFLKQTTKNQIAVEQQKKEALEADIVKYDDEINDIKVLGGKLIEIEKIKKTAPPFGEYYTKAKKYLPASPADGQLKKISFNSPNAVVMELDFPDILALTKFLAIVESDEFINDFESIRFSNIVFTKGGEDLSLTVHLTFSSNETEQIDDQET